MASPTLLTGSCSCKRVRYTSTALPSRIVNCHCVECRKASGGPYQPWIRLEVKDITWEGSPPKLIKTSQVAARSFCDNCGCPMSIQYDPQPGIVSIPPGSIDDSSVKGTLPKPSMHVFLKEKASWFDLPEDGLERWDGFSAEMDAMYNQPTKS